MGLAVLAESPVDPSGMHVVRVGGFAALLAQAARFEDEPIEDLAFAAMVCDIGMVTIPPVTQKKGESLDESEKMAIRVHPIEGVGFLSRHLRRLDIIEPTVRHHHERWDGRGYPDGLAGDESFIVARITAIADAFDVMTHGRPYMPAVSVESALNQIERQAGKQFDPDLSRIFVRSIREGGLTDSASLDEQAIDWVKRSGLSKYAQSM